MSPRRWLLQSLLLTLLGAGGIVALNARLDIYGLFRDTHGRSLPIYDSERRGKYLLSHRYVPENFQGVLLGSSVTSNWDTAPIRLVRTYNESTDGGNVTEAKILAETVLRTAAPRLAICIVHPYLTDSHGLNADEMRPAEYWAALGSTSLLRAYKHRYAVESGRAPLDWNATGAQLKDDVEEMTPLNPVLQRILQSEGEIHVDEIALGEYRDLVGALRARGTRLVAVVPATYQPLLGPARARLDRYNGRVLPLFAPGDLVVDFNSDADPAYAAFRADRTNYRDGVHLSSKGAAEIVRLLDARIQAWAAPAAAPAARP